MNPMTNVKNIKKLSEEELKAKNRTSWHEQYRCSAWIFIGGLPYDLTEGDIICVFSQYGEPVNINLIRDKETGESKGFCFICYEDQRSTDLAVDNLNGIKILGRTIRVDHVENYKPPKTSKDEQLKMLSKIQEKALNKAKINIEDFSMDREYRSPYKDYKLNRIKKKKTENIIAKGTLDSIKYHNKKKKYKKLAKKKTRDSDLDCKEENEEHKKKRKPKHKLLNSRNSSLTPSQSSVSSSASTSSSSSSSLSSSLILMSPSSDNNTKKNKNENKNKNRIKKKKKTIEDLKKEARLIQAELKRRQHIEEQGGKLWREPDERHPPKKKSKSNGNGKDRR